ncbi:hypothetical protein CJU89_1160 [Yarrowia sp. B02]|nr:hypothetical protein CJU89_1160 [Yarrowia sp. B02]
MQLKNVALLSMAALAVAAPNYEAESPQDIHQFKDKIHSKKCPKPDCPKSVVTTTTQYTTATATITVTSAKNCAPTQDTKKNHCPKCGDPNCGGC